MDTNRKKLVGIEIGGTKLQLAVGNLEGTIEKQLRYAVDANAGAASIRAQIENSLSQIGLETIASIGVGFGGPVNWESGAIQTSHQVAGWSGFNLKDWLKNIVNVPVAADNDANVAALAEAVHGSGKGHDPVFYMTVGSGIGGGLIHKKAIYHGAIPGEAEIGHIRLSKAGNTVESECSGWAVDRKVQAYIQQHPQSLLAQRAVSHTAAPAALLKPALETGNEAAQEIVNAIADDLAFALSHVVHLFHPQIISIGGGLSLLGEQLRQPVASRLPHYIMAAFLPPPVIAIASLRENVVPVGALELAKNAYHTTL